MLFFFLPALLIGAGLFLFLDDDGASSSGGDTPEPSPNGQQNLTEGADIFDLDDAQSDTINALGGDDLLTSDAFGDFSLRLGSGNDTVSLADGESTILAREGDDSISSMDGTLTAVLGNGDDWVSAGNGEMDANGNAGDDTMLGGTGDDTINGGVGWDSLLGGRGADLLEGSFGDDTLRGGEGDDTLDGGKQWDDLLGGAGNDVLNGGAGFDRLNGGAGTDTLNGNENPDRLFIGTGQDLLRGGAGSDTYVMDGTDFEHGALLQDITTQGEDGLDPVDQLLTWQLTDNLSVVFSGNGNAEVTGGGFEGSTQMEGIMGLNHSANTALFYDARSETDAVQVTAFTRGEDHSIFGGSGDDSLRGGDFFDPDGTVIDGGAGDDTVGGSGDLIGGTGNDEVWGDGTLNGGEGNDRVSGQGTLLGGVGNDTLATQGFIEDFLPDPTEMTGGEGTDTFILGAEYNTFNFTNPDFSAPIITDFEAGEQIILDIDHFEDGDPVVTTEEDSVENEVRILVNGTLAVTVDGVSSLPPDTVELKFRIIEE